MSGNSGLASAAGVSLSSTKIPNCRYVVGSYAMYARYGKQRAGIAGGSDGCCATRHYAFN